MPLAASQNRKAEIRLPEQDGIAVEHSIFLESQLGVIAKRDYARSETIFVVDGPILAEPTRYSFAAGFGQHIEPQREDGVSDFGHYLNHSCDPNVIVRPVHGRTPRIDVIARRDIRNGEELAFDYASLEYDVTVSNVLCQCGTGKCRSVMHGFKDMPEEVKERYRKEGIVAGYLLGTVGQHETPDTGT